MMNINRNDPCACGSGLKYKKCCIDKAPLVSHKPNIEQQLTQILSCAGSGNLVEAAKLCKALLEAYPEHPNVLFTSARVMFWNGRHDIALALLQKAISLEPDNASYYGFLAHVYWARQEPRFTFLASDKAIALDPNEPSYIHSRALFIFQMVNSPHTEDAISSLRTLIINHPRYFNAYETLYNILDERMLYEEAAALYQKLVAQQPPLEMLLPFMAGAIKNYGSRDDITRHRERLEQQIDKIAQSTLKLDSALKLRNVMYSLTYHATNNRPLLEKLSALYRKIYPALNIVDKTIYHRVPGEVIKIGFISSCFFESHVVMVLLQQFLRSVVADSRYKAIAFDVGGKGANLPLIKEGRVAHVVLPDNVSTSTYQLIAQQQCDVLVYLDIGLHMTTYLLAFARLAPLQLCLNGHPITTGISTIDYYVSSRLWESEHAQDYYSEKLITLDHLLSSIEKPKVPAATYPRKEFGFPEEGTLYACPVTMCKIHPDFYDIIINILEKDPQGFVVFFEHTKMADNVVLAHLKELAPEESKRVVFVPWIEKHKFIPAMALCDVVIDTVHFGSFITLFSILAAGTPVVTWPGEFSHGRVTMALYELMGIPELIAKDWDDYARIAVRLGKDKAFNQAMRKKILERNHVIYGETGAAAEFKQVLEGLIAAKETSPIA